MKIFLDSEGSIYYIIYLLDIVKKRLILVRFVKNKKLSCITVDSKGFHYFQVPS